MLLNIDTINNNLNCLQTSSEINASTTKLFTVANERNKENFARLLYKIFSNAVINYEVRKFLELNNNNEILLNKQLNDEIAMFFKSKGYGGINGILTDFARGNYFQLKDGEVEFRELKVDIQDVQKAARDYSSKYNKFFGISDVNYDAILTSSGDLYLAYSMHDYLIPYLIANSVDLRECVRISYVPNKAGHYGNNLVFSTLYPYRNEYRYGYTQEMNNDKVLYLRRSNIRKLCEFAKVVNPNLTKEELLKIFQYSEFFGYNFMTKLKKDDIKESYNTAMENLEHISSIVEDEFPDQNTSINLIDMFEQRLRGYSFNFVD